MTATVNKTPWLSLFAWCKEAPAREGATVYAGFRLCFSLLIALPWSSSVSGALKAWGPLLETLGRPGGALALEVWTQHGKALAAQVTASCVLGVAFGLLSLVPLCLVLCTLMNPGAGSARDVLPQTGRLLPNVLLLGLGVWAARLAMLLASALAISLLLPTLGSITSEAAQDGVLLLLLLTGLAPHLYLGLLADLTRLRLAHSPQGALLESLALAQSQLLRHNPVRLAAQHVCVLLVFSVPSVVALGYPVAVAPAFVAVLWMLFGRICWLSRLRTLPGISAGHATFSRPAPPAAR